MNESQQEPVNGALELGRNAAKTAVAAGEIAAQASSGNIPGAAITALKNKDTFKQFIKNSLGGLVMLLCAVALIQVFFLYALPMSVYEGVNGYVASLYDQYETDKYSSSSSIEWATVTSTLNLAWNAISEAPQLFKDVWEKIKSFGSTTKDDEDTTNTEIVSDDGSEAKVVSDELSQKTTLQRMVSACKAKVMARSTQIKKAISSDCVPTIQNYYERKYGSTYDEVVTNVNIVTEDIADQSAAELLSAYMVMRGGDMRTQRTYDFYKWLGYYSKTNGGKLSFAVGDNPSVVGVVPLWDGTFMPEYLVEQEKQELTLDMYGDKSLNIPAAAEMSAANADIDKIMLQKQKALDSTYSKYQCAAVDMILTIDCPELSTVTPTITYVYSYDEDGNVTDTTSIATIDLTITIRPRSIDDFVNTLGLWKGSWSDDQTQKISTAGATAASTNTAAGSTSASLDAIVKAQSGSWCVIAEKVDGSGLISSSKGVSVSDRMISASLIKLYIMATVYDQMEKGNLKNTSTVQSNLTAMITQSDNNATNALIKALGGDDASKGMQVVNSYISANGYTGTQLNRLMLASGTQNYTTAKDCCEIIRKIYSGKCVNAADSQKMLNLLLAQKVRTKIPAGLPNGVKCGNKTGELSNIAQNDAAIVYTTSGSVYVICAMSNSANDSAAISAIKSISGTVYNIMNT